MRPTTRFLPAALAALCAGCTGLPDVLPHAARGEPRLPLPEEQARGRPPRSSALTTFRLENGLKVALLEDREQPRVVVDTWFDVGSRDEGAGQRGCARLFAQLMSIDAESLENEGGSRHASAGVDRCISFSMGPAALLPSLLRRDAERLAALQGPLSEACLVLPSAERRVGLHTRSAAGGGQLEQLLCAALYPPEHPYHAALGARTELEPAAVRAFFGAHFVPARATLVVAGDFEPADARAWIEGTFGALAARPAPPRLRPPPLALPGEVHVVAGERGEFARLALAWHSPASFAPGDAELELLATILAEGAGSRLEQRLVLDLRLAQEVDAGQQSAELGSVFVIEAVAAPGIGAGPAADASTSLDELEREILSVLEEFARSGPTRAELARAQARQEARFLRRMESLLARAEAVQAYLHFFARADGFERDLARWTEVSAEGLRATAAAVLGAHRVDLRILPAPTGARAGPSPSARSQP